MKHEIENIRHSFAHLLAAAVKNLYPAVKFGIGPTIENGFYYDFDNIELSDKELPKIQKEMVKIARQGHEFKFEEWDANKSKEHFRKLNQPYKIELIENLVKEDPAKNSKVGMVHTGDALLDLCRGGHVENTKDLPVNAFQLTRVAGAYWRGDEKRPMLTRVYGLAFNTKDELEKYLTLQKEAEKRDHKKLGKELGLFIFSELVGPGLPLFTPKGAKVRKILTDFVENLERQNGYEEVWIPHITKPDLYKTSGHLEKFKNDLFYINGSPKNPEQSEFILKPMNCPHHTQIYKSQMRSYKDLPVRFFETTTVYRNEQAGELGGLTRVRSITQDDGHVFMREDQIAQEFKAIIKIQQTLARAVNLKDYWIRLSLRDEKNKGAYIGDDKTWQNAQREMEQLLKDHAINYESKQGEAAFYGPKMDFIARDSIGREWQFSTIQLDFNLPERFGLEYVSEDGSKKTPIMMHRAFMGSVERFMAMLIEHYAGAFPLWLAPEQIWIVPVSEKFNDYAQKVSEMLEEEYGKNAAQETPKLRLSIKSQNETLPKKIRAGQIQKVPYILIVGEREQNAQAIAVRDREKGDLGLSTIKEFVINVKLELQQVNK
ncbi:MAG: threonine--tRNA ligase [Candidatus Spechtbacteria bacterium RIFCSPHIGHO2_01_FULL_43_30]|uniref:Threonine--tRNA ligase n=1 Tax=Candidatus Spechtbacteria bacterium RIFCSPHIGHO2_01_FULL_43_30 TaxID=1802158 RepID=A0A1G2H845_9BACT|nr:MAG: threonine--tRNA ligase [Candidatus Spechtbacteria bacterium RIFCSPHIGHO2_01_FULL_43_30]